MNGLDSGYSPVFASSAVGYIVDGQRFYCVIDEGEGYIADSVGILCHCCLYRTISFRYRSCTGQSACIL